MSRTVPKLDRILYRMAVLGLLASLALLAGYQYLENEAIGGLCLDAFYVALIATVLSFSYGTYVKVVRADQESTRSATSGRTPLR